MNLANTLIFEASMRFMTQDSNGSFVRVSFNNLLYCYLPSGLNCTEMTASACPSMVLVHRVTALTLNTAWG